MTPPRAFVGIRISVAECASLFRSKSLKRLPSVAGMPVLSSLPRVVICTALIFVTQQAAPGAARENAVFCSASAGARVLAVATIPDGRLRFGLSVWSQEGSNISVFGGADRAPGGWRYMEKNGGCEIGLIRGADGGFTIRTDPVADCRTHGGYGARIGTLHFTAAEDEGPVTTQLDDAEAFQHAGRCADGSGR
jgi:hypothetical protein